MYRVIRFLGLLQVACVCGLAWGCVWGQTMEGVLVEVPTDFRSVNSEPHVLPDGDGGFYTIWKSQRGAPGYTNIYAQHVPYTGAPAWAANGVAVAPEAHHQTEHTAVLDAVGCLVIAWCTDSVLCIQRLSSRGQPTWRIDGVIPSNTSQAMGKPRLLPDREGGVYVFWEEFTTSLLGKEVYGQRLDSLGRKQWGAGGRVIATGPGAQQGVQATVSLNGEVLVMWEHQVQGENIRLWCQKLTPAGEAQWHVAGVPLLPADVQRVRYPSCYGDGFGGLLVTFEAIGPGTDGPDVFIARVNLRGELAFSRNVCRAPGNQLRPRILQKGGEAWLYWDDDRTGQVDVYGQRVDIGSGLVLWGPAGIALSDGALAQRSGQMCLSAIHGDPVMGVLDHRLGTANLFAQKLDSSGHRLWSPMGLRLANLGTQTLAFAATDDQRGGTWWVWLEQTHAEHARLMYQHLDANGIAQFATGVPLCVGEPTQGIARLEELTAAEGFGQRYVAWEDFRHGDRDIDVYVQRLDANGKPLWRMHGEAAASAPGNQEAPILLPMPDGVVVGWIDRRNQRDENLYLQFLDTLGRQRWAVNGLELCTALRSQTDLRLLRTSDGEVLAAWTDSRNLTQSGFDVYLQRISSRGVPRWVPNGVPLCSAEGFQTSPVLAASSSGGAYALWMDERTGTYAVYIQQLDASGRVVFEVNGRRVSTATGHQREPTVVTTGPDRVVVAWADDRFGPERTAIWVQGFDYAQQNRWQTGGQPASPALGRQTTPRLWALPNGDVVLGWLDQRREAQGLGFQLYLQRLGELGQPAWPLGGSLVASHLHAFNPYVVRSTLGGLYAAWTQTHDGRERVHWARLSAETGTVVQNGAAHTRSATDAHPQLLGLRAGAGLIWVEHGPGGSRIGWRLLEF